MAVNNDGCECDYCNHQGEPTCRAVIAASKTKEAAPSASGKSNYTAELYRELAKMQQEGIFPPHKNVDILAVRLNSALTTITPPEDRDCDTCENDGDCLVTMLQCKGYAKNKTA